MYNNRQNNLYSPISPIYSPIRPPPLTPSYQPPRLTTIKAIPGVLIQHQYQPQHGDAIVIQGAIFKGEIVKMGDRSRQTLKQEQCVLKGQGLVSQDCRYWKMVNDVAMNVFKLGQLQIKNMNKIKAKFDGSLLGYKILKITTDKDHYLAFKQAEFNQWFLRLLWAKLILQKRQSSQFGQWTSQISGKLYKKTAIMGDWQIRYVSIDRRGLRCSKKDDKKEVNLQIKGTKEIWTRFEEIRGGSYLIVKLWNGIMKEEFAVPTAMCLNWVYHFLGLLNNK